MRAVRPAAGFVAGVLTAVVAPAVLLGSGLVLAPALLWPPARPVAYRRWRTVAARLADLDRHRRARFFGERWPAARHPLRYLAARITAGLLGGAVLALLGVGLVLAALVGRGLVRGSLGPADLAGQVLLGGVLLFLDLHGLAAVARLDTRLARRHLGPDEKEELRRRITDLAASRAGVVRAVDRERQRIERDLHDGVQQRLVALALLLGRARRQADPAAAGRLLAQAHHESEQALGELREVAWRAYPSALDTLGLAEALAAVADRAAVEVRLHLSLDRPLPRPVQTATYFLVSEAVTNAVKHSGAGRVDVTVTRHDGGVSVLVADDGTGGADPGGSGLSGLALRLAALDGVLRVHSPAGGPTEITGEIPCD